MRLEDRNHRGGSTKLSGDPLQDNVSIYDTVRRRYAGFSNVLRDLHGDPGRRLAGPRSWHLAEWVYAYGIHRMSGSGASFYPKSEGDRRHGYCNTALFELANHVDIPGMVGCLRERMDIRKQPTFTSLGNQPPPFPKPRDGYRTGGSYYFCEVWPEFAVEIAYVLSEYERDAGPSIADFTDYLLECNRARGFKAFKFAFTALVMDFADWHPEHISPLTQCHYGNNCMIALNAMYSDHNRNKSTNWYHECMEILIPQCSAILGEEAAPMDVEDSLCDAVRYWSRFVPRHGYDHIAKERRTLSKITLLEFARFCAST